MFFDALKGEHDKLRIVLTIMSNPSTDSAERRQYFNEFKRLYTEHAEVEELFVFTPLQRHGIDPKDANHSLAHQDHDSAIQQLNRLPIDSQLWLEVAKDLKHSLMQHMREEEESLFPLAEQHLPRYQQQDLARSYSKYARL